MKCLETRQRKWLNNTVNILTANEWNFKKLILLCEFHFNENLKRMTTLTPWQFSKYYQIESGLSQMHSTWKEQYIISTQVDTHPVLIHILATFILFWPHCLSLCYRGSGNIQSADVKSKNMLTSEEVKWWKNSLALLNIIQPRVDDLTRVIR